MELKCIIIDDEPLALGLMESYVKKTDFLNLRGKYSSAVKAISEMNESQPDLIFVDIQMPDLSGLEFSKMIGDKAKVIFTTAFEQYAIEGFKVNALDYLLKPISYTDFLQAANKALQWFELTSSAKTAQTQAAPQENNKEKKTIFVKTDYKLVQIELKKILYIEGLKDYVKIHLEDEPYPILSLMSMKSLEDQLPEDKFIRVHRSFIVQPQKIKVIERNRIVFGKQYIPISDSYKDKFQAFLNEHALMGM
ncbi:MAG TPA: LytTR family DNA-binding domain-containing protein [Paludibacteraceae bacterium]|jgi:DNA-binding LytR/AlgR family response regulator|nr:LytTR family DNA-binding domain-containing protein [Paludibacteraceae bacterium]HOU68677.1 LytTR family DNA-binding domain-containing protein [Paludibacteraceae bacterium]HQF50483.1 LytTR family DNA-binding domain-containing protein [Paludibacteraceae bacterium]